MARLIRTFYDNAQQKLKQMYYMNCGKVEGEYKGYHSNEQPSIICNFVDGKIEGEYKSYYDSGQLNKICYYINGIKEGEQREYFENGQIRNVCNYINGQMKYEKYVE